MKKTIGTKINVMIIVLVIIFGVNIAVTGQSLSSIANNGEIITEKYLPIAMHDTILETAIERSQKYINIISMVEVKEIRESVSSGLSDDWEECQSELATIKAMVNELGHDELIQNFVSYEGYITELYDMMFSMNDMVNSGQADKVNQMLGSTFLQKVEDGVVFQANFIKALNSAVHESSTLFKELTEKSFLISGIMLIIFLISIIMVKLFVTTSISKPAQHAGRQISTIRQSIHDKKGDLTERIQVHSKDEIGLLVSGINEFLGQLQEIMNTINTGSVKIRLSMESVNGKITDSNDSVSSISSVLEELSAGMQSITATLIQLNENTKEIFEKVVHINEESNHGYQVVEEIRNCALDVKDKTEESRVTIEKLIFEKEKHLKRAITDSDQVGEISRLTYEIMDVSEKTNLLALNASIEAASAGEAGRGFAVIAEQIRALADNSQKTANNIQKISKNVIFSVNQLIDTSNELLVVINDSIMKDYKGFSEMAVRYYDDSETVNDIFERFNNNTSLLKATIGEVSKGIHNITEAVTESSKGITEVAESTNNLALSISDIQGEMHKNLEVSNILQSEVNKFQKM